MEEKTKLTFEEIAKQNERRVHYHIHRLSLRDPHEEFFQEGLVAMWNAYEKHEPDKGPLATYFNYTIRNRLIDLIRKKAREQQNDELFIQAGKQELDNGNRSCKNNLPIPDFSEITVKDANIWEQVQETLTENQWKWVYRYIILDMPVKDIAEREGVTVDAVKSWGRQARKKLRNDGFREKLQGLLEV